MKNYFIHIIVAVLYFLLVQMCQSQDILWEKSFGGRHAEYLSDVQATSDYGFILGGSSLSRKSGNKNSFSKGDLDFWIWKMDENGEPEWQKSYGGSGTDQLQSMRVTHDGGFILAGTSNSIISFDKKEECRGGNDYWIIKLDAAGEEMWQRTLGGKGQDDLTCVIQTTDGGYLLGGSSNSDLSKESNEQQEKKENSRGNMDYWIIKLNSKGEEEWQKTYGGDYTDLLKSVVQTKEGGYVLGGYSTSGESGEKNQSNYGKGGDFWILKIDKVGRIEWQQTIGGNKDDQFQTLIKTYDGGYLVGGTSISGTSNNKNRPNGIGSDFWVIKLDEFGEIVWQETYDFGEGDVLTSLIENEDNTFLIGGYSIFGEDEEVSDYIALKVSQTGERLWQRTVGSDGEDILRQVIETRDGSYLMAGTSNPEFTKQRNRRSNKFNALNPFDSNGQHEISRKLQKTTDSKINEWSTEVNSAVAKEIASAGEMVNQVLPNSKDSNFRIGLQMPTGNLVNPSNTDNVKTNAVNLKGPKPGSKFSRDKKMNYGNKDYWVVKLKDEGKKIKERFKFEATPNPTSAYTNIIIGFEFNTGLAVVYDISGRQLQQFTIKSRTVPVNLANYPTGIYIVNIKTNKGEGSVKIIKN
ncbi:T9SS type A sorting domain-containing protein [Flavobacterium tegetincola]|uniref:T9SS type A sorting domain-containing protein n=1 Tax=Flavobacterium tegetincola TaxID=150172 RepID=UPI000421BC59|nr:T9SS type A sorting domain-containing protein [Flavobacterium tegetincola]